MLKYTEELIEKLKGNPYYSLEDVDSKDPLLKLNIQIKRGERGNLDITDIPYPSLKINCFYIDTKVTGNILEKSYDLSTPLLQVVTDIRSNDSEGRLTGYTRTFVDNIGELSMYGYAIKQNKISCKAVLEEEEEGVLKLTLIFNMIRREDYLDETEKGLRKKILKYRLQGVPITEGGYLDTREDLSRLVKDRVLVIPEGVLGLLRPIETLDLDIERIELPISVTKTYKSQGFLYLQDYVRRIVKEETCNPNLTVTQKDVQEKIYFTTPLMSCNIEYERLAEESAIWKRYKGMEKGSVGLANGELYQIGAGDKLIYKVDKDLEEESKDVNLLEKIHSKYSVGMKNTIIRTKQKLKVEGEQYIIYTIY